MKFAHLADVHLGAWGEQKLRELNSKAFCLAIDKCISSNVDFILLSGDLFNTALPAIECLKLAVRKFKEVKDAGIPVYYIAGSHDYSPSGKTMLDVMEEAGLMKNAVNGDIVDGKLRLNFIQDKTGAKITGMLGKKGGLEKEYYKELDLDSLEKEEGFKIFMFHTAITELKPKELEKMESNPVSFLPKGFDYYAGGHVHIIKDISLEGYKNIVFPGPIFPNNFSEIEKLGKGGFYIYTDGDLQYEQIFVNKVVCFNFNCEGKTSDDVLKMVESEIQGNDFNEAIVTLRFFGLLSSKVSDIDFKLIMEKIYDLGAFLVLKNSNKLSTEEFKEVKVKQGSLEETEQAIIEENIGQSKVFSAENEKDVIKKLISVLSSEKGDGERVGDYDERLKEGMDTIIKDFL